MSGPFGASPWGYNPSTAFYDYTIDQSLRFEDGKLTKTISSAGDGKTFTVSMWIKRAETGVDHELIAAGHGSDGVFVWRIRSDDTMQLSTRYVNTNGANFQIARRSTRVFRDVGAWYHCVLAVDTTVSGASSKLDYFKIYVNGEDITSDFTTVTNTEESVAATYNDTTRWNQANNKDQSVGYNQAFTINYFAGYLAEIHSISGTKLTADSFGETKNGVWVPKEYTGSYGSDGAGFYFNFADSSDIGNDASSGGSNDYTPGGLVASDVVPDSPTNNFATLNFNDSRTSEGWKEGGLNWLASSSGYTAHSTMVIPEISDSDTYYAEVRINAAGYAWGISPVTLTGANNSTTRTGMYTLYHNGRRYDGTTAQGSGNYEYATVSVGDIFGIKAGNGEIRFFQNGTDRGAAFTGLSGSYKFGCWAVGAAGTGITWNFGQDSTFHGQETAGTTTDQNGFGLFNGSEAANNISLCAANIAEPAIGPNSGVNEQSDDYFNTVLYTGDGTNGQAITGVGFQPDWLWIKSRSGTAYHELHDSVRGAGKRLFSNDTAAESNVGTVSSFDSDGFTVSRNSAYDGTNQNSVTFVGWSWKANGTAVSNSDGSVSSTVSANTDAGFSIVQYEGLASGTQTVGHGLNSAPEFIIFKNIDDTSSWVVYSEPVGTSGFLLLNSSGAKNTSDVTNTFNSTAPTNSVFTVGTNNAVGGNGETIIAYCFHSVDGYSKVGSYVGNGNANGTFVHIGFRPAWVMFKQYSGGTTTNWLIVDNKRDTQNVMGNRLLPDTTAAENNDGARFDFVSNGIKLRESTLGFNQNGVSYIYLAFAEAPFKYANAR